jgi:hypothetical protein
MNPETQTRSWSYKMHDSINVPVVGSLAALCIGGIFSLIDTLLVTKIFLAYIVLDTVWIIIFPASIPNTARFIIFHHLLTFCILLHPLRYPEHSMETCRDGIVELNTFFLILRRQLRRGSFFNLFSNLCYNATLGIRFLWQPYLIYHFYIITNVREGYPYSEFLCVLGSQVLLCIFNICLILRRTKKTPEKNKRI